MLDESHITEVSDGARVRARAERQLRSMLHEEPSTHDAPEEARAPESSPPHPIARARQLGHDKLRAIDAAMEYIDRAAKGGGGAANEKENADENRASETSAVNASPAKQASAEDGGVRRSRSGRRSAKSSQEVDVEKWRAIQTWASVDSVAASMEAANGRPSAFRKFEPSSSRDSPSFAVGDASELPEDTTAADDVMSSRHLLSSVGDPTPAKSAGGRGGGEPLHHNLPDTLSPITQVAEPPVHDDLANVQPAIVGTGDGGDRHRHHRASASKQLARQRRLDDEDGCAAGGDAQLCAASDETPASKHPAWATPGPNGDGTQLCGTRDEERSRVVPSSTDAGLALDLEVTRRREREARAAMEKMERAVETLKTERDDAVERAMRASVAADAAHAARDSALSDSRRASTETARLRKKVADAATRLEEDDRELARLRDLLAQQAAAAEDAAGAMSADVAAAKDAREASLRDLEDAEARRATADRALAELKETHRTFVADAGDQLDQLTSQVAVLKARLSAQDAREAMIADQEAQIEDLRRRLDTACAGVEGPVASALRRARATLRNATSETGPGFAAEHDESFRAFAGEDGDGDEGPGGGLDLDKAAKARLEATPMLAAQATKLAADVERAADVLAERLCETRERSDDLRRRCDAATEFENGAEALRDAYVKSTKECERLAKELASLAEANESAQKSAKDADDLASAAMEARDRAESAAKAARENAESSVERAEAQTARAEARAAKAELLASAAREAQAEAEAEAAQATAALDAARRREAHAAAAAARATDEIVAKEAAAAAAVSSAEELTAIVTSLKTQVADLKTTLAAAETKAASAEGDANAARDECERALRRAEDAETAAATYKIRADSADADVEVKSERIRELRAAVADALGTRADDEDTVAKLNEELLAIGEKYAAAREEAKANKDALADAAKRVESLEDELATARLLAESATDDAVDAAGEYFAAYAEETQDLVHFLYDGAEKVNAEVASAKRREGEFRGAFAAVLAALDSAVAGAYAPETRADANDPPPVPDFESLAPARLAPPTGKTLDHGLADVTSNAAEDAPAMPRPEGDPDGNGEVDGSNPRALAADEIALAAEARGTWAAKQLSARVHAVVYERTMAATQLAAAREAAANADAAASASDAELASLRSELASAEKRAAEFGEAAAAAKADAARLATEAKELRRSAEDAETKERAIVATDAAGKLAAADERASELQSRLDAAEERALSAAAEADAGAARAEEAATAAAEAEAAAAEADGQLAQLAEESERLAGALIESETSAAQYQRAAMEAERRVDELYSDLTALRAFVDVGVSVAEPVFRRVDALRRENLALRARVPMLAQRCVGARGARLKALRERNSAVRERKSFADAFERGKKKYYELEVAFNETRLAMHDDLRKEKKKAVDARDVADKAAAELDAIVKKQERLRRELKLSVDRHKSTAKESTAKLRDLEQRVAEAESKLRESQVDRAKNSRRAKELEQQCAVLKKSAKAAEKSRASAVAELSAKQAELSEADARLKHAEAAAAAAAAAALASAQGAETLTAKLESQIDSSDRVRELREALTAALEAKAAAEEKLASDVAALEADVKELIFLGSQASTAKKEIGARSTTASSFDLETPASSRTMMPSPTPSEDAAAALSAIHPQRLDLLAATGGGTPMEASTSKPPRLAVVVSDADAVAIAPTPPPPRASHAAADDATDNAGVNTTNNNNTVDLTADMAALEEEAESLRAEVEALRLEVAGARAEAAAGAQRAAVLEDSIARLKRAAAEAESIAAVDSETRLATHAAIEASVTDAIGLAVDVDETDGDVVDGEDLGPESSETPPGATIARAGTPPLPPAAAAVSPSRRAQLNAAGVSAPRPPSPLGLNAVHGLVATGSLAVDPRERPSPPEEGSLAAALEQMLPINGAAANKMPSRNSSACASANSLASIAEGSSGEEDGEDADADATDGEASVDSPSPAVDNQKGGDFAELETELALRRKLAREASRKAQSLSQECQTLSVALEEAKSAASRFEKRAAAAEKIAANAISHAEVEEERHAAYTAELTERCEALAGELRAANESRDAAVKEVEALELRLSDIASDGASATNTRPNTPSPVKGENDPAESVPPEVSEMSEVRLSINVVDGASREREDDLLARAELAESAVAELRAKLESANVRVAAAEDELRAARKTVEETAKTVEETAERADASAETIEELRARVHASDAELVDAKHEADAYRSALADAEAKLVSSAEAEKVNHQSLVRRVDEAEKNLADALARCADMSERRDAAESRAASAGAAADSASAAAAESHAAMLDAERSVEDVKREMEDVKRGAEAEAEALGARLEAALTELADARALAVGLTGSARAADDGDPESFPSDAADDGSAAAEDVADESRGEGELEAGGSGSGSIVAGAPAELLEELVRRRVREAQLEADAAKLRVQLDAAESRLRRTRAELEDSAGKFASDASADSGAGSVAGSDARPDAALASELAEYKATCAHLRSMLDAKEEALEEVERRAVSAAEAAASFAAAAAAATPTRSPPVEKIAEGADPGAVQGTVDQAVVEAAVEKRLAAVGSIIETWRRAVEAKELEITSLAAKIDELEASAANHTENPGSNGDDELAARLAAAEREVRDAADKLAAALLASEDPAPDLAPVSKTKRMPLRVAADAAAARLAYLAKRADVHESETRELVEAQTKATAATHEAAMAKADARLAELARALKESAESEGRALAAAAQSEAAKASAEEAFEKCVDDLRAADRTAEELRARVAAGDSRGERDQGGQARALMLQAECSELRAKVEKRNREVRELNQMLKAWEAMRHSKDQQIAQLVERCRKFEEEAADKARAIDAMRSRLGRGDHRDGQPGGASVGAGSVGSVSFNRTPRRSPTGTSMRLSPSPAPSSVSSFAFGTRAPSGGAAPSPENIDKENPERSPSATKRFAAMAALGGESPGRPAGGSVKGSIDAEVSARVGGGVGASPRGGVPSPKRALRTIGR